MISVYQNMISEYACKFQDLDNWYFSSNWSYTPFALYLPWAHGWVRSNNSPIVANKAEIKQQHKQYVEYFAAFRAWIFMMKINDRQCKKILLFYSLWKLFSKNVERICILLLQSFREWSGIVLCFFLHVLYFKYYFCRVPFLKKK